MSKKDNRSFFDILRDEEMKSKQEREELTKELNLHIFKKEKAPRKTGRQYNAVKELIDLTFLPREIVESIISHTCEQIMFTKEERGRNATNSSSSKGTSIKISGFDKAVVIRREPGKIYGGSKTARNPKIEEVYRLRISSLVSIRRRANWTLLNILRFVHEYTTLYNKTFGTNFSPYLSKERERRK